MPSHRPKLCPRLGSPMTRKDFGPISSSSPGPLRLSPVAWPPGPSHDLPSWSASMWSQFYRPPSAHPLRAPSSALPACGPPLSRHSPLCCQSRFSKALCDQALRHSKSFSGPHFSQSSLTYHSRLLTPPASPTLLPHRPGSSGPLPKNHSLQPHPYSDLPLAVSSSRKPSQNSQTTWNPQAQVTA